MPVTVSDYSNDCLSPAQYPEDARTAAMAFAPSLSLAKGTLIGKYTTAEGVTVDLSGGDDPTGGTFTLTHGGETTDALAYNASAATVQAALRAFPHLAPDLVSVSKSGFVYTITFDATLGNVGAITADSTSLTNGGTQTTTITVVTSGAATGGLAAAYDDAQSDGRNVAVGILKFAISTDASGNVYLGDSATASEVNVPVGQTAPVYVAGVFNRDDLTGYDANALADLNGRVLHNGFIKF